MEFPLEGFEDNGVPLSNQIKGIQRKTLYIYCFFYAFSSRYYTKAEHLVMAYPELLQSYFELAYSATLQQKTDKFAKQERYNKLDIPFGLIYKPAFLKSKTHLHFFNIQYAISLTIFI